MITARFDNSYARLPEGFFARIAPSPLAQPRLVAWNADLADRLGLQGTGADWVQAFAGGGLPQGAEPLAQAYAGHQFGGFVPQLGDGRAILLGEVIATDGARHDIVIKGAGRTPFSRMGDGRAWLGPVLREYLLSEAMAALGVPTTRALAAIVSDHDKILREQGFLPAAIVVRVAASHLRVGTFQYFAAREDRAGLERLLEYAIARHYPQAQSPADFLRAVCAGQARLVAHWMALGFIHGVMNTDNMTISGETIDYGPAAFMDRYHSEQVFSAIDRMGRYAFGNQPNIAAWNLAQLATALLPLMEDHDAAIAQFTDIIAEFGEMFQAEWDRRLCEKIGILAPAPEDIRLGLDLLALMEAEGADFTRTFRALARGDAAGFAAEFTNPEAAQAWRARHVACLTDHAASEAIMRAANPARIARTHQIESVISAALSGDYAPFFALHAALRIPYADDPILIAYEAAPLPHEIVPNTFCGT